MLHPAIETELAYLLARGGELRVLEAGFVVENDLVRELGDYNAFLAYREDDLPAMTAIARARVKALGLSEKFPVTVISPAGPASGDGIAWFWVSHACEEPAGILEQHLPDRETYWRWYEARVRQYPDFEPAWWQSEKIAHHHFTGQFTPVWYVKEGQVVGRLYRCVTDRFVRLFSVEIESEWRGQGFGTEMIRQEVTRAVAPVYIRAGQRLENFYKKGGFSPCFFTRTVLRQP